MIPRGDAEAVGLVRTVVGRGVGAATGASAALVAAGAAPVANGLPPVIEPLPDVDSVACANGLPPVMEPLPDPLDSVARASGLPPVMEPPEEVLVVAALVGTTACARAGIVTGAAGAGDLFKIVTGCPRRRQILRRTDTRRVGVPEQGPMTPISITNTTMLRPMISLPLNQGESHRLKPLGVRLRFDRQL
ncbi:MAG: hypothetical protein R2856_39085 [Caldilineaceae bacterium]